MSLRPRVRCGTMGDMKTHLCLALWCALLPAGCGKKTQEPPRPQTPQEMYARVRELLQPNAEHDASEFAQAMEWLVKAAEGGHLQAQTDLGGIYLEGGKEGVQPDGQKAYYWFSRAAEQGSKEALYYMGLIAFSGKDMPADRAQALRLWQQAAEAGVAEAQLSLGLLLAQQPATARQGADWLVRAVQAPAPKTAAQAARALGFLYAGGKPGIARDMAEAARWYKLAADGGDAPAQLVYALMLLQGEALPKDVSRGMSYLRLAAGQDNPAAIRLLIQQLRADGDSEEAQAWAQRLEKLERPAAAN